MKGSNTGTASIGDMSTCCMRWCRCHPTGAAAVGLPVVQRQQRQWTQLGSWRADLLLRLQPALPSAPAEQPAPPIYFFNYLLGAVKEQWIVFCLCVESVARSGAAFEVHSSYMVSGTMKQQGSMAQQVRWQPREKAGQQRARRQS